MVAHQFLSIYDVYIALLQVLVVRFSDQLGCNMCSKWIMVIVVSYMVSYLLMLKFIPDLVIYICVYGVCLFFNALLNSNSFYLIISVLL